MPPHIVDARPVEAMWLVEQLIQHETDNEKWWKHPHGFNLLDLDEESPVSAHLPPPGYERLPMEE